MKGYEIYNNLVVPKNSNIVLRIDGRSFHNLAKNINLEKPYDTRFSKLMMNVSMDLFKEFSPYFIYTFSDEISILLKNIPFNGRIEKIDSVIASFTASSFSFHFNNYFDEKPFKPTSFDCRIIPIINNDIWKYFKWRQDEAWRNCVNGYGAWYIKNNSSSITLNGMKNSDIHEMLYKGGINLNDIDNWKKRGIGIYKKENKIFLDCELPIFTDSFFNRFDII